MLTCTPRSFFSWDFNVEGLVHGNAGVEFNFFTEQGVIRYSGAEYSVCKYGWLSGQWGIESGGQTYVRALKTNPLLRKFEIQEDHNTFQLRAMPLTRCYEILQGGAAIGSIVPDHFMTRRATIECSGSLSELGQLFCFWLAALTWRRAARSNSN
jgi:hypothetical protein